MRWGTWLLLLLTLLGRPGSAEAKQVALVVGNAKYVELAALKNPKRDAAVIADRLRDLGFEVIEVFDADTFTMERSAKRFLGEAKGADLALFYFAGHGIQLFDRNVLLASDASPYKATRIGELGLDLASFLQELKAAGPVRTALLVDACRDNVLSFDETVALLKRLQPSAAAGQGGNGAAPPVPTRGLARMELGDGNSGAGAGETLLYFAAQPGRVSFDGDGQNSYFVEGLKEALGKADRPLSQVFQQASAYVRTVTRGEQVPQVVSDWTGDIVLGETETAKVRYLNVSSESGRELTEAEIATVGKATRAFGRLSGTFIVQESQSFVDAWLEAPESERKQARALGMVNGFAIDYDLDRDGREETIGVYVRQVNVLFEIVDEGVSTIATPCYDDSKHEIEAVDVALRDINGDRRPEVFLHLLPKGDSWGIFCLLEYKGVSDVADARRGPSAMNYDGGTAFRVLIREPVMQVEVANDNTIQSCSGSNCHTRSTWKFDGERFSMIEDQSERPEGARAKPFRDEEERKRLGAVEEEATETTATAAPADEVPGASGSLAGAIDQRVAAYLSSTYLPDGLAGLIQTEFSEVVQYYGKPKSRVEVLTDKRRHYAKWPKRQYEIVPGTLSVSSSGPGTYDVAFEYTFRVANDKKKSEGRGRTRLTLIDSAGTFVVSREEGETISP